MLDLPTLPGGAPRRAAADADPGRRLRIEAPPAELAELAALLCRDVPAVASIAQRALHQDPRYRAIRLTPAAGPGRIAIRGELADYALLRPLLHFAREWGGISLQVDIVPAASPTLAACGAGH